MKTFSARQQAERIHPQQTCTTGNVTARPSGKGKRHSEAHVPEMAATQVSMTALKVFKGDCWEEKQHIVWFRARVKVTRLT